MSVRRTARSSVDKRLSYREESDSEDAGRVSEDGLTEDEFQAEHSSSQGDDEDGEEDEAAALVGELSEASDEQNSSSRAAKRRKTTKASASRRTSGGTKANPQNKKKVTAAAAGGSTGGATGDDWEPGTTRVVMTLAGPPKTGHVPRGQISPNVLDFFTKLQQNNDREWFAKHDAVYRYVWKNFCDFVDVLMNDIMEQVDATVPWLPVKDVVYRIYRDVRFSNDKTPYKSNLMVSFSRGGRKGPFAGYHVMVKPGGKSFFGAGRWQPEKDDLAVIRNHIIQDTPEAKALKAVVKSPTFVKWFGQPKRKSNGQRSSLWGCDDELKIAPKIPGVDKSHKDIEWLRLRSFVVIHNFTDKQVLSSGFRDLIVEAGKITEPLVRVLNAMTSPDPPPPPESDEEGEAGSPEPNGQADNEEEDEELVSDQEQGLVYDDAADDNDDDDDQEDSD
ncbi:hypothetical protein BCV70DRAFT_199504 [Testicularia cyperi]|uniref:Uncharacterized protein n=1 Tax=Testicularia cyperi TaxID=1882483 RepID=A0A317XS36_9BASI|nr:hypothetical protein BCV70DRAFT_199504 [Testicularia cyperi]